MSDWRLDTKALHAGYDPAEDAHRSRAVPLYLTTSYTFRDAAHAADLFALKEAGHIYTRISNPTTDAFERRLAAMHGGQVAETACVATASGMSAVFLAVATITRAGQNIVSGQNLYGGTHTLFEHLLPRFGIKVRFVDTANPAEVAAAIDEGTTLVYTETIGNPGCNVDDLEALARAAHDHGVPLFLDNTMAPPPIFDPAGAGADVVVYSTTKIIGGHGVAIGGAVVETGNFDWAAHADGFPDICAPDPSYHGLSLYQALKDARDGQPPLDAYALKLRISLLRDLGPAPSPMNSFLAIQGLETLPLRARAHCANAARVASHLEAHPSVAWVNYPGLASHPDHERAERYFPLGPGAVFGFGLKGGFEAAKRFIESVELCSHLANILDARTLVIHPASTTHAQLTETELTAAGISQEMVRISVGIEDVGDIIADLDQALEKVG